MTEQHNSVNAQFWNALWKENDFEDWDALSQDVFDVLCTEAGEIKGKRILEAGSGSGRISMRLAGEGAAVTLLDFSIEALVSCQQRFAKRNLLGEFVEGSIEKMPFPNDSFDLVFNTGVLEHYSRAEQVNQLREMTRVLKPGGLLVVLVPYAGAPQYRVDKWFRERTGTWKFDFEDPLWEITPQLRSAGLTAVDEYTAGFNTLCEIGRGSVGGAAFTAHQQFWYHQLSPEEQRKVPGYLLVGSARKPGGLESNAPSSPQTSSQNGAQSGTPGGVTVSERPELVLLSSCNWDYLWQRPQQLAQQFARLGHKTVYVNGTRNRLPMDPKMTPEQFRVRMADAIIRTTQWHDEISVVWPFIEGKMALASGDITELWLESLINLLGLKRPIFWTISAEWGRSVEVLKRHGFVVFDCVDELSGFSWVTPELLETERQMLYGADMVSVSAKTLLDTRIKQRQQVYLVPNGVNPEQFHVGDRTARTRPVIGYLGAVANWVDTELIATLADSHPEWTFRVVGSNEGGDLSPLTGKSNVEILGRVEYKHVPSVVATFDVGIIPFKVNDLTHNANPIKVYEYMAAGLPVVLTPFAEREFFGDLVAVASTPEEFSRAIQQALASWEPDQVKRRTEYARHHSWSRRALLGSTIATAYDQVEHGEKSAASNTLRVALVELGDDPQSTLELYEAACDMDLAEVVISLCDRDPNRASAIVQRLLERQAWYAAISLTRQIYQEHADDMDAAFNYAVLLVTAGMFAEALPLLLEIVERGDASVTVQMAEALQGLGEDALADSWGTIIPEGGPQPDEGELRALIDATRRVVK